jgi:ribonuclease HI
MSNIKVYVDGGSRGNPGQSACAFLVFCEDRLVYKNSYYLGVLTNNMAEYKGLLYALRWLVDNTDKFAGLEDIKIIMDSELVVRQMAGVYRVKNQALKKLNSEARKLVDDLKIKPVFVSVSRDKNSEADKLVNQKLDQFSHKDSFRDN